jgi:hypothetical protein
MPAPAAKPMAAPKPKASPPPATASESPPPASTSGSSFSTMVGSLFSSNRDDDAAKSGESENRS